MKPMYCLIVAVLFCGGVSAGDFDEKAKAAIALAEAEYAAGCGVCTTDLPAAVAEGQRTGKPVLIFVGGCDGKGIHAHEAGALAVRMDRFSDTTNSRIEVGRVVNGKLTHVDTLPPTATPGDIKLAVHTASFLCKFGCSSCSPNKCQKAGDCGKESCKTNLSNDDKIYTACVEKVESQGFGVTLAVGVNDPAEFRVASGYRGIADGVYDCMMVNKQPSFQKRPADQQMKIFQPSSFLGSVYGGCSGGNCGR